MSDPGQAVPPVAKPLAPAPRVNPPNINAAKEAPAAGGPPGFSDFLEWMRSQGTGEAAPGTAAQRGLIPKEKKKFQRRDAEAKSDKPADEPPASAEPATKEAPEPAVEPRPMDSTVPAVSPVAESGQPEPTKGVVAVTEAPLPRMRRQQAPSKRNTWLGILTQAGVLVLLAGSFLLGRVSVSKVATPHAAPAAPEVVNGDGKVTTKLLSDANASLIDQAMAAEQDDDFQKADELLGQVKASGERIRGLTFQLAQVAIFQGNYPKALPLLNEAIAEGEGLGDAYNMRATVSGRSGLIRGTAMNDFETATKVDPFGAHNFFYWGEALRRVGKDQAALVRLKQAIDRLREPELESVYRLKVRLAQIEAGQEKEFADDLARHLAEPNPEMDWLITAAAMELHKGDFTAAAGYLDRASQRGDAEAFASRLRDFYLYQFKDQKELMRFYPKTPPGKAGSAENPPAPAESPSPDASVPPTTGLDVPTLPPPASPGATVPR